MGRVTFDFREGMDQEKIIYKNTGVDCRSYFYYFGYMLLSWIYAAGWFALFQYAYINHEPIAFWVYIACWLAFTIFLITYLGCNLCYHTRLKAEKKAKKHKIEKAEADKREAEKKDRMEKRHEHEKAAVQTEMTQLTQQNNDKTKLIK